MFPQKKRPQKLKKIDKIDFSIDRYIILLIYKVNEKKVAGP